MRNEQTDDKAEQSGAEDRGAQSRKTNVHARMTNQPPPPLQRVKPAFYSKCDGNTNKEKRKEFFLQRRNLGVETRRGSERAIDKVGNEKLSTRCIEADKQWKKGVFFELESNRPSRRWSGTCPLGADEDRDRCEL